MALPAKQQGLHSAEYFGAQRDFWWNQDYLALVARRLNLASARRVLDVGSGLGHWGRAILPHLCEEANIIGIDREPEWVRSAGEIATALGIAHRVRYMQGEAERLPFDDDHFDLVTCQTVLLHVRDYKAVVRQMTRVLRPGGRLLVVEPNNMAGALLQISMEPRDTLEQRLKLVRFQAICECGKEQAGEGNNSTGDRLPGLFAELGLTDLAVYQSDCANPLVPPYATAAQQALKEQVLDWADRKIWIWNESDTRRYFIAGGGSDQDFFELWTLALASVQREADGLRGGTYHSAGGSVVYLVSALTPRTT